MKEADEEGIGTFVEVKHNSPAFLGETVVFTATLTRVEKNEVVCSFTATCGSRVIATGATGQKILKKERLQQLLQAGISVPIQTCNGNFSPLQIFVESISK
ncbi:MAG: hypothetical protein U0T84_06905 [Chitinophagales bacterium]